MLTFLDMSSQLRHITQWELNSRISWNHTKTGIFPTTTEENRRRRRAAAVAAGVMSAAAHISCSSGSKSKYLDRMSVNAESFWVIE